MDWGKLIAQILPQLLPHLIPLIIGLINKPPVPEAVPTPAPLPLPIDIGDPGKIKPTTPLPAERVLTNLSIGLQWAAQSGHSELRPDIDQIRAGDSAINWTCNFKHDANPRDQFGVGMDREIAPGTKEGEIPVVEWFVEMQGPNGEKEGPVRVFPSGDRDLDWTEGIDDLVCVPNSYYTPRGYGLTIRFNQRRSGRWYATVQAKVGKVESNKSRVALD